MKKIAIALSSVFFSISAQAIPKPPDTGTPSGNPTPGTTRPEAACPATPKELTALVANQGKDFTVSAYPTVWVYVPYSAKQLSQIEFILLNSNERQTIYQTTIKLTDKPGVIKITVPNNPKFALQPNQDYRWRLHLDCQPDRTVEPDLAINGWVRRLPADETLKAQLQSNPHPDQVYRKNNLWYDAIDTAATRYFANPTAPKASQTWNELLQTLNFSWVQKEPFAQSQ